MSTDRHAPAGEVLLPSQVTNRQGFFDRFATWASGLVSRAPFFAFSLGLVLAWMVEGLVIVAASGDWSKLGEEAYQLQINSTTTVITFLMVALLQNSQTRADKAVQHKLNAMADALADLMEELSGQYGRETLLGDVRELKAAVGLEHRESTEEDDGGAEDDKD